MPASRRSSEAFGLVPGLDGGIQPPLCATASAAVGRRGMRRDGNVGACR
jgi:hypothetical protein